MANKKHYDNPEDSFYTFLAVLLFFIVMWFQFGESILSFFKTLALWLTETRHSILYFFNFDVTGTLDHFTQLYNLDNDKKLYSLYICLNVIGHCLLPLVISISALWLIYCYFVWKYENYFFRDFKDTKRKSSLKALKEEITRINPRTLPVLHLSANQPDSERGAYTRHLTPWEFAVFHGIIDGTSLVPKKVKETFEPDKCKTAFISQVGKLMPDVTKEDYLSHFSPAEKIMLSVFCAYHEEDYIAMNEILDRAAVSFEVLNSSKTTTYRLNISNTFNKLVLQSIEDALFNSSQLDEFDIKRQSNHKFPPLINKRILKTLKKHDFIQTVLMDLMTDIPLIGSSDMMWLKGIDSTLFYALDTIGRPSPLVNAYTMFWLYHQEEKAFIQNQKPKISSEVPISKVLSYYDTEKLVNDFYFSLEDTNWLHHHKYKDVEDDQSAKLDGEFSYENILNVLIIKELNENKVWKMKSIHFRDTDGHTFIDPMILNDAERLDEFDAKKIQKIVNSHFLIVNDIKTFGSMLKNNASAIGDYFLRGYSVLSEIQEKKKLRSATWHYAVHDKVKILKEENDLSLEDIHWLIFNNLKEETPRQITW